MSTNRTTASRLAALEANAAETSASLAEIKAILLSRVAEGDKATVTRPSKKAGTTKKAPAKVTKVTLLRKANRKAFVAKAPWAKGLSTQTIVSMVLEDESLLPAGWGIGEGYRAMFS